MSIFFFAGHSVWVLTFYIVACVLLVISMVLWVAVAFQVGLQESMLIVGVGGRTPVKQYQPMYVLDLFSCVCVCWGVL